MFNNNNPDYTLKRILFQSLLLFPSHAYFTQSIFWKDTTRYVWSSFPVTATFFTCRHRHSDELFCNIITCRQFITQSFCCCFLGIKIFVLQTNSFPIKFMQTPQCHHVYNHVDDPQKCGKFLKNRSAASRRCDMCSLKMRINSAKTSTNKKKVKQ